MPQMLVIDPVRFETPHANGAESEERLAVDQFVAQARKAGEVVVMTSRMEMLTPAQVAERLNISRPTVSRWIRDNKIQAMMVGAHHRIPLREFERLKDELTAGLGPNPDH